MRAATNSCSPPTCSATSRSRPLYPTLAQTPGSRVVMLGSLASRLSTFRVDDLQLVRGYSGWRAYAQSKIAVQVFGFELDRRLRLARSGVISLVAHPGYSISGRTPRIRGVNEPTRMTRFVDNLQASGNPGQGPRGVAGRPCGHRSGCAGRRLLGPALPDARGADAASVRPRRAVIRGRAPGCGRGSKNSPGCAST